MRCYLISLSKWEGPNGSEGEKLLILNISVVVIFYPDKRSRELINITQVLKENDNNFDRYNFLL